jgi:DNA invertase Pin-like site-specific DNA recombinase
MISTPKVYGYARRSTDGQILSLESQQGRILEKAEKVDLTVDHIFSETESAKEVAWTDRPVMIELCNQLRKGDTLIVWRLDRIDRSFFRMLSAIGFLADRDIRLIVLEFEDRELDLNDPMGALLVTLIGWFNHWAQNQRLDAVRRGVGALHPAGEDFWFRCGNARARLGRKWVWVDVDESFKTRRTGSTRRQKEQWDEHECNLIREIWIRFYHLHQTDQEIGHLFLKRGERTTNDSPWVNLQVHHTPECIASRPPGKPRPKTGWGCRGPVPCKRSPDFSRITKAREWLDQRLEDGNVPHELAITDAIVRAFLEKIAKRD